MATDNTTELDTPTLGCRWKKATTDEEDDIIESLKELSVEAPAPALISMTLLHPPVAEESIDDQEHRLMKKAQGEPPKQHEDPKVTYAYAAATGSWSCEVHTSSEWRDLCHTRWEDTEEFLASDPFVKEALKDNTDPDAVYQKFYQFMQKSESDLLNHSKAHTQVQRLVRKNAKGERVCDITEVYPIGCTLSVAIILCRVSEPQANDGLYRREGESLNPFYLATMAISDTKPVKTDIIRRQPQPATLLENKQFEMDLENKFSVAIDNVDPCWVLFNRLDRFETTPYLSALDPVTGNIAIMFEGNHDKVVLRSTVQSDIGFLVNSGTFAVELPLPNPDILAISATHIAVAYLEATVIDSTTKKKRVLPPHIAVCSIDPKVRAQLGWGIHAPVDGESLPVKVKLITCIDFHRSIPSLLLIGTRDSGVVLVDCNQVLENKEKKDDLKPVSKGVYYGRGLKELSQEVRAITETPGLSPGQIGEKLRAVEGHMNKEDVWFVNWRTVGQGTGHLESRVVIGYYNSFIVNNSSEERVTYKRSIGKDPHKFIRFDKPMVCADARGGVFVVHDAARQEVLLGDLSQVRAKWTFAHPDIIGSMGKYERPYPSIAILSKRVVILWPTGFVGFIEPASEEVLAQYAEEKKKLLIDRMTTLVKKDEEAKKGGGEEEQKKQ